jgi:hypothetical protein
MAGSGMARALVFGPAGPPGPFGYNVGSSMAIEPRPTLRWALALSAVCALAAALRLFSIGHGLPATFNPDEVPILNRVLALGKGDPNPRNFLYPSLYFYAAFAWEGLFYLLGRAAGLFTSLAAFERQYFTDPSKLFLAARMLTAVFGIATVPALYWYGRRLYGRSAGLIAAAFLAVAPVAVRDAQYVKLDVPVALFVVLAHAMLALIVTDRNAASGRRAWFLAGLLAGLAVSTHYYAALLVVTIVAVAAVHGVRTGQWRSAFGLLVVAGAACCIGFLAGTPFLPFEPRIAMRDIAVLREVNIDRAVGGGGLFSSFAAYAQLLYFDALGWPVCLLAGVGFAWALVEDRGRGLLLVSFTAVYLAFISNTVPMTRYLNIVLPMFALAAAFTVVRLAERFGRRAPAATAVVAVAAIVPGLLLGIRTDRFLLQKDTRALAKEYIEARIPPGSSILVQPYSAPIRQSRDALVEALRANLGSESRASVKYQLMLGITPYPSPAYRLIYLGDGGEDPDKIYISPKQITAEGGLAPLRAMGVQYVVLKGGNVPNPALTRLEAALEREGRRLVVFEPYRADVSPGERLAVAPFHHNTATPIHPALERPGPSVVVWSID